MRARVAALVARYKALPKSARKALSLVLAAALGAGVGLLCPKLPAAFQPACHAAAKLIGGAGSIF